MDTVAALLQSSEQRTEAALAPPAQPRQARPSKDRLKGAKTKRKFRQPDPLVKEFAGCFHCGSPDHARSPNPRTGAKGCPDFQAYLKSHGGKLPEDYAGRLEKFIREKKKGSHEFQERNLPAAH